MADPQRSLFRLGLLVVAAAALASAAVVYQHHAAHERGLWVSPSHDRHAHYRYGLEMAADVRSGNLLQLGIDFEKGSIVWPPLHGLLLAAVLTVGWGDPALAVAPSLIGWAAAAVFAYLAGNRAVPRFGPLAGVLAAAFVLGNPTFRAYAVDCMLESLGGGLTFAVLFTYLRWEQDRTRPAAAWFGLALSLLFYEKYNYWLLAVLACGLTHLVSNRVEFLAMLMKLRGLPWRAVLLAQLRRPLNYLLAPLAALVAVLVATGGFEVAVLGRAVSLRKPEVFVNVLYALVLLRLTVWWWLRAGRSAARAWLGEARFPLVYWHLVPVSLWFLVPLRLTTFVWFLSPANGPKVAGTFAEAVAYYWTAFAAEYATPDRFAQLVLLLVAAAMLVRGYAKGGGVVPVYAAVGVALTVKHPNHHPRYFFTAAAGLWLTAACGAGLLAVFADRAGRNAGLIAAAVLLAVVGFAVGPHLIEPAPAIPRGAGDGSVSLRDLTDAYLDETKPMDRVAVFGSHQSKFWVKWSWVEKGRPAYRVQFDFRETGTYAPEREEQYAALFGEWLRVTKCEVLVFVDIPAGSPFDEPTAPNEGHAALRTLLPAQDTFQLAKVIRKSGRGEVQIRRRVVPAGASSAP